MSLSVSAANAEAMTQQLNRTLSAKNSYGTGFQDVMLQTYTGGSQMTESMDAIFKEAANRYGISESLLKAVAKTESNFNPNAVSSAGAQGVMQLMPSTARNLGVEDSFDARQNIMAGAKYLKSNLDKFGDVSLALAAYNAGPGNVERYDGIPPFSETQNYVKKVMSYLGQDVEIPDSKLYVNSSSQKSRISALGSQLDLSALFCGSDGISLSIDKEDMSNLLQMMRIQMMMEADQSVGEIL